MILSDKIRFFFYLPVIYGLFAVAFSACSDEMVSNPVEIRVSTGFGSASGVESRSQGSITKENILSDGPLPVSVVRVDQTSESVAFYLPYNKDEMLRSGRLERFNLDIRMSFDSEEYYLSRSQNNNTKLIGWYPAVRAGGSTWSVDGDVATVDFNIDGDTDVMMTALIEGNKENPYSGDIGGLSNKMVFRHLLTRFRVRVYTYDADVETFFGGITGISLVGKLQSCEVRLPAVEEVSGTFPSDITFVGNADLPLIPKDPAGNTSIPAYDADRPLPVPLISAGDADTGLAGYAMVAPVYSEEVTLLVTTENRGVSAVKIKAPTGGFAPGKSYTLAIEFRVKGIEFTGVTIHNWETEAEVNEDI